MMFWIGFALGAWFGLTLMGAMALGRISDQQLEISDLKRCNDELISDLDSLHAGTATVLCERLSRN